MLKTRQLLWTFLICSILAVQAAFAQSTLTQIQDTVTNTDGSLFNGTIVITWNGLTGSNAGSTAPLSTSARVYNGSLSVLLVPTTTASASSFYQVVYYASSGVIAWTETWQVPPSTTPLTISAVRTSSTQGTTTTTGGTTTGSGSTASGVTLPISMTNVTGLAATLAALNSAIAALSAQLTNYMSSNTPTTNAAFVDADSLSGTQNGTNPSFALSQTPFAGLNVFRNGLLQSPGVDYTISGSTVTFASTSAPKSTDSLSAFYRTSGIGPTARFADAETPGGAIDGVNVTFTLANAPNPALSLRLYKNGILMTQNADYSLNGNTLVFTSNTTPALGDTLLASYRY